MLEHIPEWLGASLRGVRAGAEHLAIVQPALGSGYAPIVLSSPAFGDWAQLPVRFTADGAGVSPPLAWEAVPPGTQSLALIVEDADSPTLAPLVHAIVWGMAPDTGRIAEGAIVDGAIVDSGATGEIGRNSFLAQGWLAPDPPSGHGEHRYVFQLFALDVTAEDLGDAPGRSAVLNAMQRHVIGAGMLTGLYSRGEVVDAPVASATAVGGAALA